VFCASGFQPGTFRFLHRRQRGFRGLTKSRAAFQVGDVGDVTFVLIAAEDIDVAV
jgi:hypothetical protein